MRLVRFWHRHRHERAGFRLYGSAVAAARDPFFYTQLGVPDTLNGRFDLVGLHAFLLIRQLRRLPPPGPDLAQAVFDAMFSDMDVNLREMGVGDLSVGKRVRKMWEAFHGRAVAYDAAMDAADPPAMEAALTRNVWQGVPTRGAAVLARLAFAQAEHLATQPASSLGEGRADFLPTADAAQ